MTEWFCNFNMISSKLQISGEELINCTHWLSNCCLPTAVVVISGSVFWLLVSFKSSRQYLCICICVFACQTPGNFNSISSKLQLTIANRIGELIDSQTVVSPHQLPSWKHFWLLVSFKSSRQSPLFYAKVEVEPSRKIATPGQLTVYNCWW